METTLTLTRTGKQEGYTAGVLFAGNEFLAHTLEPQWRNLKKEVKVAGCTCIPEGVYQIALTPSAHFRRTMPLLLNVPGFTGILIHWGNVVSNNSKSDSKGCILVGERDAPNTLKNSRVTFEKLYARLKEMYQFGQTLSITIQ